MAAVSPSQRRAGIQISVRENATPCVVSGHPRVEFIGGYENGPEGEGCAIVPTAEETTSIVLSASTPAHAVITFLNSPGEPSPDYLRVALPDL